MAGVTHFSTAPPPAALFNRRSHFESADLPPEDVVPRWDFHDAFGDRADLFKDPDHLSAEGAARLAEMIMERMRAAAWL